MTQDVVSPSEQVTYEYATVRAERDRESLYQDTYRSLGWTIEGSSLSPANPATVTLKLKRPRRITNRPQVVELQRKAERALSEIASLEKSKSTSALATALTVGIVGTAFLAGSVFAIDADNWGLSIPLGTVGLLGWLAGYLSFGWLKSRRTATVVPRIEDQYDIVYEASEQAAHLLR